MANEEYDLALAEASDARLLTNNAPETLSLLGHLHAVSGQTTEAEHLLEQLIELSGSQYVSPHDIHVHVWLVTARGLGLLARAVHDRAGGLFIFSLPALYVLMATSFPDLIGARTSSRAYGLIADLKSCLGNSVSKPHIFSEQFASEFLNELDRKPFDRNLLDECRSVVVVGGFASWAAGLVRLHATSRIAVWTCAGSICLRRW